MQELNYSKSPAWVIGSRIDAVLLSLCLAWGGGASFGAETGSANWPQWRGPLANGVAPEENPPTTWTTPLIVQHEGIPQVIVCASGRVYLVGRNGTSLVLKNSGAFDVLATNRLDEKFDASPAIAGKEMFLRGHEYLHSLAEK